MFHSHSLYLVAPSVNHCEVRHFKIDRLSRVDLESLKFNKPADFDLQQHFTDSFGGDGKPQRIRIRFSQEVARFEEESHWHNSQILQKQPDGSLPAVRSHARHDGRNQKLGSQLRREG